MLKIQFKTLKQSSFFSSIAGTRNAPSCEDSKLKKKKEKYFLKKLKSWSEENYRESFFWLDIKKINWANEKLMKIEKFLNLFPFSGNPFFQKLSNFGNFFWKKAKTCPNFFQERKTTNHLLCRKFLSTNHVTENPVAPWTDAIKLNGSSSGGLSQ